MRHTATVYNTQRYFEIRLESFINVYSKDSGSHYQCIIVIVIIVIVVFITVPVLAIIIIIIVVVVVIYGPGSSLGIVTDYGLDGPGSNPGGEEIFRPSRPAPRATQPPVKWVPGLSRG
jgi:hypothetical protein